MQAGTVLSAAPDVRAIHELQHEVLRRYLVAVDFSDALAAARNHPDDHEAAMREALAFGLARKADA